MTLQSSGQISLQDIATEFGGTIPHGLNEYYDAADGIPASGTISLQDFYGTSSATVMRVLVVGAGGGGGSGDSTDGTTTLGVGGGGGGGQVLDATLTGDFSSVTITGIAGVGGTAPGTIRDDIGPTPIGSGERSYIFWPTSANLIVSGASTYDDTEEGDTFLEAQGGGRGHGAVPGAAGLLGGGAASHRSTTPAASNPNGGLGGDSQVSINGTKFAAGGGGGATGDGVDGIANNTSAVGGAGGTGTSSNITGINTSYGGGGGGGSTQFFGSPSGVGGGGSGGSSNDAPDPGTDGLGGGGGGGYATLGGDGGNGTIIISSPIQPVGTTGSPTIIGSGPYIITWPGTAVASVTF